MHAGRFPLMPTSGCYNINPYKLTFYVDSTENFVLHRQINLIQIRNKTLVKLFLDYEDK